jgi:hypothetical protein
VAPAQGSRAAPGQIHTGPKTVKGSIKAAVEFKVSGGAPEYTHKLADLLEGVDRSLKIGALAALAQEIHGKGNLNDARAAAKAKYEQLAVEHGFDPATPDGEPPMPQTAREALAKELLKRVSPGRREAFRTFIADDLFAE